METTTRRVFYTAFFNVNKSLQCLRTPMGGGTRFATRAMSTTRCLRAKPPPAKKAQKKPLDYKPSSRRPPPRPSAPPPIPPKPHTNPLRYRTIPIVFGGITLFSLSAYIAYLCISLSKTPSHPVPTDPAQQSDVSHRYDDIAKTFDASVDWTESLMGLVKLRKRLAKEAKGDVLEVSVGTGRNLEFYNFDGSASVKGKEGGGGKVESFTAVDKSAEMVEVAREKFGKLRPDSKPGGVKVRWVVGDASSPAQIPPAPNQKDGKYDTVLQTMGLCSVTDPIAFLKHLGEIVKPGEGRILLLEHGRGKWSWLNDILDKFAEGHAREFGCWWNRDLEGIVKESGLEVVRFETWHGGTTAWVELRKGKCDGGNVKEAGKEKKSDGGKKGWW
ncbi:uncharacterized protein BP5553_02017 [Venustampulla echinocandica]|uniref:S-adenosyl-L-methionine-dependent methyltransferase n=1 Tax=Venustampulla echinocandica TaxID=2656787 RepID=A0A370U2M9_9HELO|nr:uncharacterized protein BP5553_02017 [Venustampulla echinocandica]RDL42038.1 hypothetical protein BP5553_02017 [Venustampulla echinocandica]